MIKIANITQKWWKKGACLCFFLTGWGAFWVLTWILLRSGNSKLLGQTAPIPDFDQLTFGNLPPTTAEGSITIPSDLLGDLNYDPNRQWEVGDYPTDFLKLGDFQDSFQWQELSFLEISQLSGSSLNNVRLSQVGFVRNWTLEDMANSLPQVKSLRVKNLPIVQDLLKKGGYNLTDLRNQKIGQLINSPELANLSLDSLNLNQYRLNAIPQLSQTPLRQLKGWQNTTIADIPLLSQVPFNQFPNSPLLKVGGIGQIDLILGTGEQQTYQALSGSYQEGFNANCSQNCAHIELGGNPLVAGQQWVSGQHQKVEGGHGALKALFNGQEPTGLHPFGDGLKVVLWDVDETTDTVSTAWFFRICIRKAFVDLGCSPYGIGPFPSFTYSRDDWIFLGI